MAICIALPNVIRILCMVTKRKKWKDVKSQKFQHQQWACHGCRKSKWSKCSRKQRVKGRGWQMWIAHTHTSLDTLSAGDLKIYSSTYPILRYSYHTNCKMMRQGIALAAFSPSSFYINHLETAHPLSATWRILMISCIKKCVPYRFLWITTKTQTVATYCHRFP